MKILVVAGASGGHIFPAFSFLDTLREKYKDAEILLILPEKNSVRRHKEFGYKIKYISVYPIKVAVSFRNIRNIFSFFKAWVETIFILLNFKPDVVVGFGTLVCLPVVICAKLFRIKTLIHEQNVIPGRANRFLAIFSNKIAISFSETKDYFGYNKSRVILTGNPIRKRLVRIDKKQALDFFKLERDKFTILLTGGSQGSWRLNFGFLEALVPLINKSRIQVVHLSGFKDYSLLKNRYKSLNINIKLFSFLDSMQYAYSCCDLVLSRAGATTITEIIYFRLPSILIPYPYAYKHQLKNAKVLEDKGCAIIIKDEDLDKSALKNTLELLINDPSRLNKMRLNFDQLPSYNAGDLMVNEVLSPN